MYSVCGVRGLWVFSGGGEVIYSRRFPLVERHSRNAPSSGRATSAYHAIPFDSEIHDVLKQAASAAEDGGACDQPAWKLALPGGSGSARLLGDGVIATSLDPGQGSLRADAERDRTSAGSALHILQGPGTVFLSCESEGVTVAIAPLLPGGRPSQGAAPPAATGPEARAVSCWLPLLASLIRRVEASGSASPAALRSSLGSYVLHNLPYGWLDEKPKWEALLGRQAAGTPKQAARRRSSAQPGSKQQHVRVRVSEYVTAWIVPEEGAAEGDDAAGAVHGATQARLFGSVAVDADEGSPDPVGLRISFPDRPFQVFPSYSGAVAPEETRAGEVALTLLPPLSGDLAARYRAAPPSISLPFTGAYSLSADKPPAGATAQVSFSLTIEYHMPSSKALLDACWIEMELPSAVVSLDTASSSLGTVRLHRSALVWSIPGSAKLNARNSLASCSGSVSLAWPLSAPSCAHDASPARLQVTGAKPQTATWATPLSPTPR
mmetsp:Transcript_22605/g.54073  ORF Transcript_22605/g.54073 Transcript_22605/m.54073 type:complete len:492 (-) Transcript_22605:1393-2868(-)